METSYLDKSNCGRINDFDFIGAGLSDFFSESSGGRLRQNIHLLWTWQKKSQCCREMKKGSKL